MTALIVILCVLLFFAVLLVFPVTVQVTFEHELSVKIKYLFISYTIVPQKRKKAKKSGTKSERTRRKRI